MTEIEDKDNLVQSLVFIYSLLPPLGYYIKDLVMD